jgi:CRP-like cAMP-binding protein
MNSAARENNCFPMLRDIAPFRDLPGEQLRFLAAGCFPRQAAKGLVIFEKGARLDGFYAVREGRVKLAMLSPEGAERVVQIVLRGETFAEALGLLGAPSPIYGQALCDSELLFFRAEEVRASLARWPGLGTLFLHMACSRVHDLYRDLEASCLQSARQRVAGFLLDTLDCGCRRGEATDVHVVLPAGKAVVASRLNLTPETFSRELRHLCDEGMICVERGTVRVHDLIRLRAAAGRD